MSGSAGDFIGYEVTAMPTPPSPTPQLPLKKGISLRWLPIGFILLQSLLYGFGDPISKSAYESGVRPAATSQPWLAV